MSPDPLGGSAYRRLDPLRTRIETHRRYTIGVDRLAEDVLSALMLSGTEAVLDVGCGTGQLLVDLNAQGHRGRLLGVDTSAAAIAAGRRACADVEWCEADAGDLPIASASFDRVAARHMLYHVDHPRGALEEARRVLRPGGRLVATVNIVRPYRHIMALVADAFEAHGCPAASQVSAVDGESLRPMLTELFPHVDAVVRHAELVFADPEPVSEYAISLLDLVASADEETKARVSDWIWTETPRRLLAMGGEWRDAKGYAVFACASVPA